MKDIYYEKRFHYTVILHDNIKKLSTYFQNTK